jgi:competence protein ComEC
VAALFAALFALAYTVLAGAGIPSRRALIMLAVVSLVLIARRSRGPWVPIAAAVLALLLWNPLSVLSPGFWLSVTAVAGLTAGAAGFVSRRGAIGGLIQAQVAVWLALFVPGLLLFGGLPVFGPVVNLLAVPVFSVAVVPASLIAVAVLPIAEGIAVSLFAAVTWMLDAFLGLAGAVALVPGAWLAAAHPPPLAWLAALPGIALLFAPVRTCTRLAALLLAAPVALWQPGAPPPGAFRLTVLDVGQGLAVVVRTHRHTLLFDAGPAWRGGNDAGKAIVAPFLRSAGLESIDALVVSHGDVDHRGGVGSVRARHPIGRIWAGPDALEHMPGARACAAGEQWVWDGVDFRFLHPDADGSDRGNDSSCVLAIGAATGRALLTGDIEGRAERTLVARGAGLQADLVIAPHHGSRTSSTPGFVAAVDPEWVVFAAGYRNRWGFPAEEVLARWSQAGATSYSTGESGAVMWEAGAAGEPVAPSVWRCRSPRFWRRSNCRGETGPG